MFIDTLREYSSMAYYNSHIDILLGHN